MNAFNVSIHRFTLMLQSTTAVLCLVLGLRISPYLMQPASEDISTPTPSQLSESQEQLNWERPVSETAFPPPFHRRATPTARPTISLTAKYAPGFHIVKEGETIQSIGDNHDLRPETVLLSNPELLNGNPFAIRAGMRLIILPVDGLRYEWQEGDRMNMIAWVFGVPVPTILGWNDLQADSNGQVDIAPGTILVLPGGIAPVTDPRISIPKAEPNGWCTGQNTGLSGSGTYTWPTPAHYLSGFSFDLQHRGIDIAGKLGDPVVSPDDGMVIAAGFSSIGYGRMVVVDHGDGWYSLFGHLDAIEVGCGQAVFRGDLIGKLGSTGNSSGPHLHYELYNSSRVPINPLNVFPQP